MAWLERILAYLFSGPSGQIPAPPDAATATAPPEESLPPTPPVDRGLWWLPQAAPPATTPPEPAGAGEIQDELHRALGVAIDDPELALPVLPQITDRALRMLRDEANYVELARLIAQDPALTAQILRMANSAAYCGFAHIGRLDLAFARLGQRQLRAIILDTTLRKISLGLGGPNRRLAESVWRRAVASGIVLSTFAPRIGVNADDAFLIGLLHDIGLVVQLFVVQQFSARTQHAVPPVVFDRLAVRWHEHAGLRLAEAWDLPEPLPALIVDHHRLPTADDLLARERLLIMTADVICALLGYAPYHPYDFFQTPCVQRLNLSDTPETCALLRSLPALIEDRLTVD